MVRLRASILVVVLAAVLVMAQPARHAQALVAAPLAPVLYPAAGLGLGGVTTTGVVLGGWGTGGAAVATGVGAAGFLPFAVAIGAAIAVGAGIYVGYRHLSGQPVEWFWQDGDPAVQTVAGHPGIAWTQCFIGRAAWNNNPPCIGGHGSVINLGAQPFVVWDARLNLDAPETGRRWALRWTAAEAPAGHSRCPSGLHTYSHWNVALANVQHLGSANTSSGCYAAGYESVELGTVATTAPTGTWIAVDPSWQAVGSAFDIGGVDPGTQAVVTTTAQCRSVTTGDVRLVSIESHPYPIGGVPAAIPDVECLPGERIEELEVWRTAPGTDVVPLRITDPLQRPEIVPAPSWVPVEQEAAWLDCQTGACELEVWRKDPSTNTRLRRLAPPGDLGWHLDPDRDLIYGCYWMHPGGVAIGMPLEACESLQWRETPEGIEQPVQDPSAPTQTPQLDSPTSRLSAQGCRDGVTESGFLGSRIIARGVQCALEWAFVPQQLTSHVSTLRQDVAARPPGSLVTTLTPTLTGIAEGWQQGACAMEPMIKHVPGHGTVEQSRFPCEPPMEGNPVWQAVYGLITAAIVVGGGLRAWNLVSASMGGQSTGSD